MTRHNDKAQSASSRHEARTRHNEAHARRFRWSDEAHHEAHTRHTPTRHNGCTPLGVRRAVCRRFGAGFDRGGRWTEVGYHQALAAGALAILAGNVLRARRWAVLASEIAREQLEQGDAA